MKKQIILNTLVAATLFQASAPAMAGGNAAGGIIGGIIGGVIGSKVGKGRGNTAATIGGAVIGAVIGSQAGGRNNDRHDDRRDDRRDDWRRDDRGGWDRGGANNNSVESAQIYSITRRPGGAWYRIAFSRPVSLEQVEVRVLRAAVVLREASLVTDYGQRFPIYDLTNTQILSAGYSAGSYINRNDRVAYIDIRAESYGDYADITVNVLSNEGYAGISVVPY